MQDDRSLAIHARPETTWSMMRVHGIVVGVLLTLLGGAAQAEAPVSEVNSRYGRFELSFEGGTPDHWGDCTLAFRIRNKSRKLFRIESCSEDGAPGAGQVGAVTESESTSFPVIATNGTEFHLFAIAVARGGNMSEASVYYAVAVTSRGAYGKELGYFDHIDEWKLLDGKTPKLRLEQKATPGGAGVRHTLSFGAHRVTHLRPLPTKVVSRTERTFVGLVTGGLWRPWLPRFSCTTGDCDGAPDEITDNGLCDLPDPGEDGWTARLHLRTTTWDSGGVEVRCLKATRLGSE